MSLSKVRTSKNVEAAELSVEEADILDRSTKKTKDAPPVKGDVEDVIMQTVEESSSAAVTGADVMVQTKKSPAMEESVVTNFRDMLMGFEKQREVEHRHLMEKSLMVDPIVRYEKDGFTAGKVLEKRKKMLSFQWRDCLIIKLLGCSLGWKTMFDRTSLLWKPMADYDLIPLLNGYYAARFASFKDYKHVMENGPWMIFGFYLTVRPWIPGFRPSTDTILKTLVWIRFPELALDYYNEGVLMEFATMVGKPMKVDFSTPMASRGHYARVCVEVDLNKPLVSKIWWDDYWQSVSYEGFHLICFACGRAGHRDNECCFGTRFESVSSASMTVPTDKAPTHQTGFGVGVSQVVKGGDLNGPGFGAWMVVPRRGARNVNYSNKGGGAKSTGGVDTVTSKSRFAALETEKVTVPTRDEVTINKIVEVALAQDSAVLKKVDLSTADNQTNMVVSYGSSDLVPKSKFNGPVGPMKQLNSMQKSNKKSALGVKHTQNTKISQVKDKVALALNAESGGRKMKIFYLNRKLVVGVDLGAFRLRDGRNMNKKTDSVMKKGDKAYISSIKSAKNMTQSGLVRPPDGSSLPLEEVVRRIGAALSKEHQSVLGFRISDADKTRLKFSHSSVLSSGNQ